MNTYLKFQILILRNHITLNITTHLNPKQRLEFNLKHPTKISLLQLILEVDPIKKY